MAKDQDEEVIAGGMRRTSRGCGGGDGKRTLTELRQRVIGSALAPALSKGPRRILRFLAINTVILSATQPSLCFVDLPDLLQYLKFTFLLDLF